jgi:capsular exopolysaccharide synthesis family protein
VELREYWAVAWRRKWLVLGIVAATLTATWTLTDVATSAPRYRATAVLLLSTSPGQTVAYPPEAMRTLAVAREAVARAGVREDPTAALAGLTVAPRPGTSLVDVHVETGDRVAAARLANGFARAYLAQLQQATLPRQQSLEELREIHEDLREQAVAVVRSRLGPTRTEWELRWLHTRDEVLARAYADALLRQTSSGGAEALLVDPAVPPRQVLQSQQSRKVRALGGVGMVALLGALALVFLLDYLDARVRGEADVERMTGLRVLATLPSQRRLRRAARKFAAIARRHNREYGLSDAPSWTIPDSRVAEAFQSIRVQIELAERDRWAGRRLTTLLVVSPWSDEDKTWVAAYLGAVFAGAGRRVILVSADLHRPRLERLLAVEATVPGLNEAAANGGLQLGSLARPTWIKGLTVVPAGVGTGHPADVLASAGVSSIVEAAQAAAEVVVIEGPPVLAGAEASVLLPHCDGVVLVVRCGKTTEEEVLAAKAALEKVRNGAELLGCVITDVSETRAARQYQRRRAGDGFVLRRKGRVREQVGAKAERA